MKSVADPMTYLNLFTYIEVKSVFQGRLASVSDKTASGPGDDYFFTYHTAGQLAGKLDRIYDPTTSSPTSSLYQEFDYYNLSTVYYICEHYSRRGTAHAYYYNIDDESPIHPDANLNATVSPEGVIYLFEYDADRNRTEVSDTEFGLLRYNQYDANGNLLSSEDLFENEETWTYDAFNNLTSHTDRLGNITRYYYDESHEWFAGLCDNVPVSCGFECDGGPNDDEPCEWDGDCPSGTCEAIQSDCKVCLSGANEGQTCNDGGDCPGSTCDQGTCDVSVFPPRAPTLLTRIVQPNSGGNPPANQLPGEEGAYPVTRLNYYLGNFGGHGQLMEVIDPNGVWTGFEYDLWGQRSLYTEGRYGASVAGTEFPYQESSSADGGGHMQESSGPGGSGGSQDHDAAGNIIANSCLPALGPRSLGGVFVPENFAKLPCSTTAFPSICSQFSGATYSPKSQLLSLELTLYPDGCSEDSRDRIFTNEYHALGMLTSAEIESNEFDENDPIPREFTHNYDLYNGEYTRTGPDEVITYVELDHDGRMTYLRRGDPGDPVIEATYTYLAGTNLLESITYSSGSKVEYTYDSPNRVSRIKHYMPASSTKLQQDFTYTDDDLPATITETGAIPGSSSIAFTYDHLRRLVAETRTGTGAYNLEYVYDYEGSAYGPESVGAGGNRTAKIDHTNDLLTEYHYDIEDPEAYQSKNNRLEYFEVYDTEGKAQTLLSTTWYYYRDDDDVDFGNVTRIVTKPEASAVYKATRFGYARNGRTVTFVVGEEWEWDENPAHCPTDYTITYAKEFRYDGARQRYLVRDLDTEDFENGDIVALGEVWTDYDGDSPYGDFELTAGNPPTLTELTSHEPGLATVIEWTDEGDASTFYHATDHVGSVRHWTDNSGFQVTPAVYTAFGEIKYEPAEHHRYGYVGSHGYQQHDEFKFLHVGHRYYDPATGRFLQRDPLGIIFALNVYSYVSNLPSFFVDPLGLYEAPGGEFAPKTPPGQGGWKTGKGTPRIWPKGAPRPWRPVPVPPIIPPIGPGAAFCIAVGVVIVADVVVEKATGKSLTDRIGEWAGDACVWCFNW